MMKQSPDKPKLWKLRYFIDAMVKLINTIVKKMGNWEPEKIKTVVSQTVGSILVCTSHITGSVRFKGSVTVKTNLSVIKDPYGAAKGAHGVCILTEWNEFKFLDYQKIYDAMEKPVFFFDERNVVNVQVMRKIGFIVYLVGKPLDDWIKDLSTAA
ncbi:hypothetical protein NE237_001937 [Protea cynaroides]|uniref:UDP-glucose/GDP-mannose dehydrogenase C-terminal domain-containing protein n=1 Tax=Protea cynaroides TaxID=273540 RepID=A0A9Q0KUX8_9MAGN|nr:hypothetical protein NE237_001937 [Protea cynaroides]